MKNPPVRPLAPSLDLIHQHFAEEIRLIDSSLVAYLDGFDRPSSHYGMLHYHFGYADGDLRMLPTEAYLPRGKRMRPLICMLFCRMFGLASGVACTVMMATEVMHAASLVHDDIEDRDAVRWNRPTLQAAFGIEQAINAGDALIGMVYQLLLGLRSEGVAPEVLLDILGIFNQAHIRMCEGQHLDLRHRSACGLSVEEYFDMAERKTGAACICIADGVGVLALVSESTRGALRTFGRSLGILYQICDDVRGIWGLPEKLGREVGHDVSSQRPSLPLLYGCRHGSPELRKLLLSGLEQSTAPTASELAIIRRELVACGASQFCHAQASRHHADAVAALAALGRPGAEARVLQGLLAACFASVEFLV